MGSAAALDGDLGRRDPDGNFPSWLEALLPRRDGGFNRTDAEVEMANRLWRFVASPEGPPWMVERPQTLRPVGGLGATDVSRYYGWLHGTRYRSSAVRYATIGDDIEADLGTIPGAFQAICAVRAVDHQRTVAIAHLPDLEPAAMADLDARQADNERRIADFVWALRYRFESYSFALDHLLVETPDPAARAVDQSLAELQPDVALAEDGAFCGKDDVLAPRRPASVPALPSRFVHGNPPRQAERAAPLGS
jgi:hypothetical protein